MRSFQRCFLRAGVKMVYSEGYSPHQKMTFALPLGVGITSISEYFDAEVEDGQDPEMILKGLQEQSGRGFDVYSVSVLEDRAEKCMSTVRYAQYEVTVTEGDVPSAALFNDAEQVIAVKKTKSGEKETDLKPLVKELEQDGNIFRMLVSAGNENNLKAELLTEEIYKLSGMEYVRWNVKIMRTNLMAEGYVPLEDYQTVHGA